MGRFSVIDFEFAELVEPKSTHRNESQMLTELEDLEDCLITINGGQKPAKIVKDRYLGKNIREFQVYFPETGEVELIISRYVTRYK
jgi:hypothetical protein